MPESPSSEQPTPYKSSVPELKVPSEWKSNIPEHLLADADPATRWIMEELSKNSQATQLAIHIGIEHNGYLRELNGKTFRNERAAALLTERMESMTKKAELMEPLFKPLSLVMRMWDYRLFRYSVYLLIFFFFTYLLPYYLQHPWNLSQLFQFVTGP